MLTTDELDRLHVQLRDSQEQRQALERQRDQFAGEFRTERQKVHELTKQLADTEEQLKGARRDFSTAQAFRERVPKLEQDLREEIERGRGYRQTLVNTQADLEAARARVKELEEELGNNTTELNQLRKELAKAGTLVAAAEKVKDGLTVILG